MGSRGRLRFAGALLALLLAFIGFRSFLSGREGPLALTELTRSELRPGVELVEAQLSRRGGRFVALYVDPAKADLSLILNDDRQPLADIAPDALLVMNAGYFTKERRATGLLVSGGRVLSPLVRKGGAAGSGVLILQAGKVRLEEREKASGYDDATLAIQAGPRLIEPGGRNGIRSDDGLRANRSIIGADRRGRLVLAVTYGGEDGKLAGATLHELMGLLGPSGLGKHAPELALDFALNLDGGQSTGLHLRHPDHRIDLVEATRVHSVLTLRAPR